MRYITSPAVPELILNICSRFLRARSFNPAAAQKQFADAESWRKKHDVDKLYEELKPDEMLQSQRFYPRWTGRRDKVREYST